MGKVRLFWGPCHASVLCSNGSLPTPRCSSPNAIVSSLLLNVCVAMGEVRLVGSSCRASVHNCNGLPADPGCSSPSATAAPAPAPQYLCCMGKVRLFGILSSPFLLHVCVALGKVRLFGVPAMQVCFTKMGPNPPIVHP
jgi:hypothetical protein